MVRKSQVKTVVFEKSQEKKTSDFISSNLPNSLYFKPSIGKKIIKNSFKSDKNCKIFLEFFKIT